MSLQIRILSSEFPQFQSGPLDTKPMMEAAGLQIVSLTQRAFSDPSLRPAPWPARRDSETHSLLRKSGALWKSIRITQLTSDSVTVGSDRIYAAIHQLGGTIRPKPGNQWLVFKVDGGFVRVKSVTIPARPFFPFLPNGQMTPLAQQKTTDVMRAKFLIEAKKFLGQRSDF